MRDRLILGVLIAIILVFGWQLWQRQTEIQDLESKLADKSTAENLTLQEKCAQQAEQVFRKLGYNEKGTPTNGQIAIYQNHYNPAFKKCFMTLETTTVSSTNGVGIGAETRFLFDAYEQREYAEYDWLPVKDKKYWEVPPINCKLIPASGDERICKSEDEYKAYVATYME